MAGEFTEEFVDVGGTKIHMMSGGSGEPLVLLHGAGGNAGWLRYVQALSERYTVYIPSHPGYGQSERPEWLETMADMASFYTWFWNSEVWKGRGSSASPWEAGWRPR